jgi:hypothetical protein
VFTRLIVICLAIIFGTALICVGQGATDSVVEIDSFCNKASAFAADKGNTVRIFGDISDARDSSSREKWREFKNIKELEGTYDKQPAYTQAYSWANKDFTYVSMFFTSPSGDWTHYVEYCLRSDGTLARSESRLNTFSGYDFERNRSVLIRRIRTKHFAQSGSEIRSQSQIIDVETKKAVPTTQFADQDEPIFRNIQNFPFYPLFKRPS